MNLGIVVIIIMAILLVFHYVFYRLTQDGTNQFVIYGIFLCYAVCIILEKNAMPFNLFNNLPDFVHHLFVTLAFILAVTYVSKLINDKLFRRIGLILQSLAILLSAADVVIVLASGSSLPYFYAMAVLCVSAIGIFTFFLHKKWNDLSVWYRILLSGMLFMVSCFTFLLLFAAWHIQQAYYWAIGFIAYVVVYEVCSVWNVTNEFRRLHEYEKATMEHIEEHKDNPEKIVFSAAEKKILEQMATGITDSKTLATNLDKSVATIDTQIRCMLKKAQVKSRLDLVEAYNKKQG